MPIWLQIIIIMSTFAGLLFAAFGMWAKFKEQQAKIDLSTGELGHLFAAQQQKLEAAERRIQNLEAIVTSQDWDRLHDEALPEAEHPRALSPGRLPLDGSADDADDAERVAQISRRLKT